MKKETRTQQPFARPATGSSDAETASWLLGMLSGLNHHVNAVREVLARHNLKAADELREAIYPINRAHNLLAIHGVPPPREANAMRRSPMGPHLGDVDTAIQGLREAGMKAWDDVTNPEALIREMRGTENKE